MGFQIGDKVIHVLYGEGVVVSVESENFSVKLEERIFIGRFTLDGRDNKNDKYPAVYHAEGYIPPIGGKEPCRFKKGDLVLTSDKDSNLWWVNVFSHVDEKGNYLTFHSYIESGKDVVYTVWQRIKPFNIKNIETE